MPIVYDLSNYIFETLPADGAGALAIVQLVTALVCAVAFSGLAATAMVAITELPKKLR